MEKNLMEWRTRARAMITKLITARKDAAALKFSASAEGIDNTKNTAVLEIAQKLDTLSTEDMKTVFGGGTQSRPELSEPQLTKSPKSK